MEERNAILAGSLSRRAAVGLGTGGVATALIARAQAPAAAQDATPAAIERSNPDVGGFAEEVYTTFAFTQTIKAGNTLYFSGSRLCGEISRTWRWWARVTCRPRSNGSSR